MRRFRRRWRRSLFVVKSRSTGRYAVAIRGTLPAAPIERLAVLRLDGDLYESTIQRLESLYDKLSLGGFVIVDDYGNIAAWHQAVHDLRPPRHHEPDPHHRLGRRHWRRSREPAPP